MHIDCTRKVEEAKEPGDPPDVSDADVGAGATLTELLMYIFNTRFEQHTDMLPLQTDIRRFRFIFDTDVNGRLRMFIGIKLGADPDGGNMLFETLPDIQIKANKRIQTMLGL